MLIDISAGLADVMLPITSPLDVWMTVMAGSCVYRRKYFPLTPPPMSYSARISSLSSGCRFILPPLLRRSSASADDADSVLTIRMPNDHEVARFGDSGGKPPLLISGVPSIEHARRQGITEHGACLLKTRRCAFAGSRRPWLGPTQIAHALELANRPVTHTVYAEEPLLCGIRGQVSSVAPGPAWPQDHFGADHGLFWADRYCWAKPGRAPLRCPQGPGHASRALRFALRLSPSDSLKSCLKGADSKEP